MTSTTTTTPTVECPYCHSGSVYGGISAGTVTCMICKGTGRVAPVTCSGCSSPVLEGQERRWANSSVFHKDC